MIRWTAISLLALAAMSAPICVHAADHPVDGKRKIVNQGPPLYPQIARTMSIAGVVKIEATVGNDGRPKLVEVKGGHPVLVQAAVNAVRNWRWEPSAHETKEPIEVTFYPQYTSAK
ncbi:MAG TPA: energy transducer TonB [Terriglobales bacterium]|nr:energy transducer TonB [Terriglobales bacterium]